jgi:hypothetical protein
MSLDLEVWVQIPALPYFKCIQLSKSFHFLSHLLEKSTALPLPLQSQPPAVLEWAKWACYFPRQRWSHHQDWKPLHCMNGNNQRENFAQTPEPSKSHSVWGMEMQESGETNAQKERNIIRDSQVGKGRHRPQTRTVTFKCHIWMFTNPSPALMSQVERMSCPEFRVPRLPTQQQKGSRAWALQLQGDLRHHQW